MKKLITLLLAAGLTFAASAPAAAIEFKPFGSAEMVFDWAGNLGSFEPGGGLYGFQDNSDAMHNYGEQNHAKSSRFIQRFILGMDIVASDTLSAHYDGIFGFFTWGGPTSIPAPRGGSALGTRAANIATRQAYLDWTIPSTPIKVRMGLQAWLIPSYATGTANPYDGDDFGAGILVSAPINDAVSVTAGWLRANSDNRRGNAADLGNATDDTMDMFSLIVPVKLDGFRFSPWGIIAPIGKDSGKTTGSYSAINFADKDGGAVSHYLPLRAAAVQGAANAGKPDDINRGNSTAWYLGFGGEMTKFDPFRFGLDFAYSGIDTDHSYTDRSGWLVGVAAEYKTAYGVPTVKLWYASGDDGNVNNGSERAVATGAFKPGSDFFFGSGNLGGNMMLGMGNGRPGGTMGASLQWNRMSFIDGLTHNFHVTYVQGTNNKKMAQYADARYIQGYLTTKDSVVELDFESVYSIYQNLAVVVDAAYIFQNIDEKLWATSLGSAVPAGGRMHFSNAWRLGTNFRYTF